MKTTTLPDHHGFIIVVLVNYHIVILWHGIINSIKIALGVFPSNH